MVKTVSVLGAGAGGCATAAHVASKGYKVNLFEFPKFKKNFEPILKKGGIEIEGDLVGFVKLNRVTIDIREALKGAEVIIIAVVSQGHREIAELSAPHLEDGQIVCYIGEPAGSLEFAKVMKEKRLKSNIILGETNTLPYVASVIGTASVRATSKKGGVLAAAFPAKNTQKLIETLKEFWPSIRAATNVFETILLNFNAIDHVAAGLMNVGRLETSGSMRYWGDGATPGVAKCIDAVANETLEIRKALGFKIKTNYKDWLFEQGLLDSHKATTYEAIMQSRLSQSTVKCAPDFFQKHRIIAETLPYSLRLISSIGDLVGVDTPMIDALITTGSVVNGVDYWKEGRTAVNLGIPIGLSIGELNKFLNEGSL